MGRRRGDYRRKRRCCPPPERRRRLPGRQGRRQRYRHRRRVLRAGPVGLAQGGALRVCRTGVHVFGASSMGALRAAELHPFGMVGVGRVFEGYRAGVYEDDDEVAVVHASEEAGFAPLSEAMVNVRHALGPGARPRSDRRGHARGDRPRDEAAALSAPQLARRAPPSASGSGCRRTRLMALLGFVDAQRVRTSSATTPSSC